MEAAAGGLASGSPPPKRRAPTGGVAPLPGATQQRTESPHTTNAFRSRSLAHGAAWDGIPVSRISKSSGHGEREQYDRESLQHSVLPSLIAFN